MQGKYEKKKEAVSEEMEVEASKMEKDVEEDFGVNSHQTDKPSDVTQPYTMPYDKIQYQAGQLAKYKKCL